MKKYYANIQVNYNIDHEAHIEGCSYLPQVENRIYLGQFTNCKEAITEAKKYFERVNGCQLCVSECYTN